jgi:hypothetical protein
MFGSRSDEGSRRKRRALAATHSFVPFAILDPHTPSTTLISSSVSPYNSYTSASICRSVISIRRWYATSMNAGARYSS